MLDDGKTKPVGLEITEDPHVAFMTLTEGRFHEVKRICLALDNLCTALERVRFAGLDLDVDLERGEWRLLSEEEINLLLAASAEKSE